MPDPSLTPGAQKSVPVECLRSTEWLRGAGPGDGGRRAAHSSGGGEAVNVAVAVASPPRLSVQSPLPEAPPPLQAPPQPWKLKPLPAVAVSVTEVPAPKSAAQVEESQSSPEGEEVTRPFPWTMTVRRCWAGGGVVATNVALTSRSASSVRSQPPVPLQAPAQLMKDAPESGTATRWTCAPAEYWALQLPRQSAPAPRTSPVPDVVRRRLTLVGSVRPDPPPELDPHPATRPAATQTRMNGARIASPTGSVDTRTAADKPDGRPSLTGKQASVRAASVAFQGPQPDGIRIDQEQLPLRSGSFASCRVARSANTGGLLNRVSSDLPTPIWCNYTSC